MTEENNIDHDSNSEPQNSEQQQIVQEGSGSRFKDGEVLTFVKVRFPGHTKSYPFVIGKRKVAYGQKVVALSDRGMTVGYINSFPYQLPYAPDLEPVKTLNKIATDQDLENQKQHYRREKEVETLCKDLIEKLKLDMNLTHVEFTQYGKKCVFYFIAPARVDFRDLVKELVNKLKIRIELRQISVRDRAAAIGGIGPCGLQLCCSSFLSKYGQVAIKMAKNQDLSLNSSKLNGVCSQLKCCISYEDDVYSDLREQLPEQGSFIQTHNGDMGRVERVHLIAKQFDLMTTQGVRKRFSFGMYKDLAPENFRMPENFEYAGDETQTVIGLEEDLRIKRSKLEKDIEQLGQEAKQFADKTFSEYQN
jgi:cell fate regulator YaaT (PSP1 superfamily)